MIVPDTSVWIEYFRRTGHPVGSTLRRLIADEANIAVTECIVMELLAGARSATELRELRSRLLVLPLLRLRGLADFEEAVHVFRACRAGGETIRRQMDCLVAVPVIRARGELLHNDSDFDAIARHNDLRIYPVDAG